VAALFPPWTNTATYVALALGALAAACAIAAPMVYARSPYATHAFVPVQQPIAFDHRHHVQDEGIPCLYCHEGAETRAYAGVPPTERCMGCHAQIWSDSEATAPLRASAESGEPIRWRRVTAVPDFVYFEHGVHVSNGVACAQCHGAVEQMAAVYQVEPMTMSFCVDCHRRTPAAEKLVHCSACHR
jgi:hypothetical protein